MLTAITTSAQSLRGAGIERAFLHELGIAAHVGPIDDAALRETQPRLDVRAGRIRPPAEPARKPTAEPDPDALAAGARLADVIRAASRETLSGIRVVDRKGIVVASSGEEAGLSLAHREEVKDALRAWEGSREARDLPSSAPRWIEVLEAQDRPQPRLDRDTHGGMATSVGRIREEPVLEHGVKLVLVSHNTKMGAAKGAVLVAELMRARGLLPR